MKTCIADGHPTRFWERFRLSCRFGALLLLLVGLGLLSASAQVPEPRRIVQFTGLVVSGDSLTGVPDALVYVPRSNRRTSTNAQGYFSLVVLAGDSILVKSAGYTKRATIPADYRNSTYSTLIQLHQRGETLNGANSPPRNFKQDFIDLRLPNQPSVEVQNELNRAYLRKTLKQLTQERAREADEKREAALRLGRGY